jgi:hypothetical protein
VDGVGIAGALEELGKKGKAVAAVTAAGSGSVAHGIWAVAGHVHEEPELVVDVQGWVT